MVDRVAVMFAGRIVEEAPTELLFREPLHPYTLSLLESAPGHQKRRTEAGTGALEGQTRPTATGCRFHNRCPVAVPSCVDREPELIEVAPGRRVRCPVAVTPAGGRPSVDE